MSADYLHHADEPVDALFNIGDGLDDGVVWDRAGADVEDPPAVAVASVETAVRRIDEAGVFAAKVGEGSSICVVLAGRFQ